MNILDEHVAFFGVNSNELQEYMLSHLVRHNLRRHHIKTPDCRCCLCCGFCCLCCGFCLQEFSEWYWNESTANWSAQPDRSTTECLNILLEMGFTNKNLNVLLLQRYDNDVTKVVAELLAMKDNFNGNRQMQ